MNYKIKKILLYIIFALICNNQSYANNISNKYFTIKSKEANVRSGPSATFNVKWVYNKKNFPVEVISEYEQWRKIKDINNDEGWIHSSILSKKRSIIITDKNFKLLYKNPTKNAKIIARVHYNSICNLLNCKKNWCKINCSGSRGWITKENIWGIEKNEEF